MPNIADRKAPNAATVAIAADLALAADVPVDPAASEARGPVASAARVRADLEDRAVPVALAPAASADPVVMAAKARVRAAPVAPVAPV